MNPRGSETKYSFEYGTTEGYGFKTAEATAGSGTSNVEKSKAITGLTANTTYHFRIVATNSHGTVDGSDGVFSSGQPFVETKAATSVAETEATLNGTVNPKGSEAKYFFEYGTTESTGLKRRKQARALARVTLKRATRLRALKLIPPITFGLSQSIARGRVTDLIRYS